MGRLGLVGFILLGCFAAAVNSVGSNADGENTINNEDSAPSSVGNFNCDSSATPGFPKAVCFMESCTTAINLHISQELNAAFSYMFMGAYFAQDTVDRPGIAKFMFEAATEERSHAVLMLKYLNTRGILPNLGSYSLNLNSQVTGKKLNDLTYQGALEAALGLEMEVTKLIYQVIEKCVHDYHGADVFTNPILDEQHESIRKLQGALQAYKANRVVKEASGLELEEIKELGEYIFDRRMLNGEF